MSLLVDVNANSTENENRLFIPGGWTNQTRRLCRLTTGHCRICSVCRARNGSSSRRKRGLNLILRVSFQKLFIQLQILFRSSTPELHKLLYPGVVDLYLQSEEWVSARQQQSSCDQEGGWETFALDGLAVRPRSQRSD
ncbi:hypothetical protein MAP00_006179 [Monascus purpureus]|nr:hypothetical protein MAP00_006179 [Monascus purpureus]